MPSFDIYAELGRVTVERADKGELDREIPPGVSVERRIGSRACHFVCDDAETTQDLIDWLDQNGIAWQDNSETTLDEWYIKEAERKQKAEEDKRARRHGH